MHRGAKRTRLISMETLNVDLLVIGWGKGGKTLAGAMARAGKKVAIVEQSPDMVGGSCINIACIPTKALVFDSHERREGEDPAETFAAAVERRDTLTSKMRQVNFQMLDSLDTVVTVSGSARFVGEREVEVTGGEDTLRIAADAVVVNTGSRAAVPDGITIGGRVYDPETIQHAEPFPQRLAVIGGGFVGLEFASMFADFGADVTVLDRSERTMARLDDDVAEVALGVLADEGVSIVNNASVSEVADGEGSVRVAYTQGEDEHTLEVDAVLVATGRRPWTDGLDLAAGGVETDEKGWIAVDEHLRTSVENVWAVGDINGGPQFTYISLDDYRIVLSQLKEGAAPRSREDRVAVPNCAFLALPLATVGLGEAEACEKYSNVLVGSKLVKDIAAMPRPKIEKDPRGIVKVIVDGDSGLILGASLMHVHADEVINLVALAMRAGVPAADLRDGIWIHPSATETFNEVLGTLV